jgi:hypothetical protein
LHWPKELEGLFDFQGAISTAGEHILSPDCSVQGISPAELFYGKQIGFALIPPGLCVLIYLIWKTYSMAARVPWRERATAGTYVPKDKMVITICVLLYFFWPTLLNQTFRLFSCREIGTLELRYLTADFEEPCFVGRHLVFVFVVGIAQILLYAIGLPVLVFLFLHRHRYELDKPVVKFRYSLFFAGFRPEKYYWEVIVALRKESTVILAVFGPNMGTPMLAHVALLVFLVQILIQLVGHPYTAHQQKLQILDVISIIVCWFTMWSGFFFLGVKKEWDKSLLVLLTMVVLVVNVVHMIILVGSMIFEMCQENGDSDMLQRVKRRTSGMVPSRVRRYRQRVVDRKSQHRLSIDFENPTLGHEAPPRAIEMVDRSSELTVNANDVQTSQRVVLNSRPETIPTSGGGRFSGKKKNKGRNKKNTTKSKRMQAPVRKTAAQQARSQKLRSLHTKRQSLDAAGSEDNIGVFYDHPARMQENSLSVKTTAMLVEMEMVERGGGIENVEEEALKMNTKRRKSFRKIEDEEHGIFFENIETEETVWEVPEDGDVVVDEHQLQTNPMKRKSFKQIEDAEHGVYFQNVETDATVWKLPVDGELETSERVGDEEEV